MRKCRNCKVKFNPRFKTTENYCWNSECKEVEINLFFENKKKKESKDWKKEKKAIKQRLKTHSDFEKELQILINRIVLLIDKDHDCMSCPNNGRPNAGHYHSVGSNNSLRFNLINNWKQCVHCNQHKSGNIIGYDEGLIKEYGKSFWEFIKFQIKRDYPLIKLSKEDLEEKKSVARGIIKWLELQDKTYTSMERVRLREKFNTQLGIYT